MPREGGVREAYTISEVECVRGPPLLGRMETWDVVTHALAHTHALTRTTTLANSHEHTQRQGRVMYNGVMKW